VASVAWLHVAPVKGLAVVARDEIELERYGVEENRRFHLVDETGQLMNGKTLGMLMTVRPEWEAASRRLALTLPDGTRVESEVELGESLTTSFYGRPVRGTLVRGPWAEALSELAGRPLRLVSADELGVAVDRGGAPISLLSTASLGELARHAGEPEVDPRRFRMLIGVDGCRAHEEDEWLGREVQVGEAVVRPLGNVGRCAVTTQDPDTGVPTLDTLRTLRSYRPEGTEPLPFGVWGEVVEPGRVRVGDAVQPGEPDPA
jgi:MOSC domain-containing protein